MTWNRFLVIWFLSSLCISAGAFTPKVDRSYKVSLWTKLPHPLQMAYVEKSKTLYVASHDAGGAIFRVRNGKSERILTDLKLPSSLLIHKGDLYFAELNQISMIRNIEAQQKTFKKIVIKSGLPEDYQNSLKRILIHNNSIYLSIGAPCNVCLTQEPYASIHKISLDGKKSEVIGEGVRLAGFLTLNPKDNRIWFSDINREKLGANMPAAELNVLESSKHYGFPYIHGKETKDNFFSGQKPPALSLTAPVREFPAHSQPTAMLFKAKTNCSFIVFNGFKHEGIWSEPKVIESCLKNDQWVDKTILEGFLEINILKGRPFDIVAIGAKDYLISDEFLGVIWNLKAL